jgi:hypothetical protein
MEKSEDSKDKGDTPLVKLKQIFPLWNVFEFSQLMIC